MDETIYVILKLLFNFALEVWFSICFDSLRPINNLSVITGQFLFDLILNVPSTIFQLNRDGLPG